jgi:hypothetical protein
MTGFLENHLARSSFMMALVSEVVFLIRFIIRPIFAKKTLRVPESTSRTLSRSARQRSST